jgi:hypothetical protein
MAFLRGSDRSPYGLSSEVKMKSAYPTTTLWVFNAQDHAIKVKFVWNF